MNDLYEILARIEELLKQISEILESVEYIAIKRRKK